MEHSCYLVFLSLQESRYRLDRLGRHGTKFDSEHGLEGFRRVCLQPDSREGASHVSLLRFGTYPSNFLAGATLSRQ